MEGRGAIHGGAIRSAMSGAILCVFSIRGAMLSPFGHKEKRLILDSWKRPLLPMFYVFRILERNGHKFETAAPPFMSWVLYLLSFAKTIALRISRS